MKIVSSGRVLNSREFYEKKKKKRRIQIILLSVIFISLISLFVYLSRQEQFLIVEVAVLGENVVDKEEITKVTQRLLAGHYLWMLPRANAFIYPSRTIERSLLKEFPRLKSVEVDLGESQRLLVTVEERVPFALYCISECFFLDEEGLIFASAPSFSSGVYFVYVTEDPVPNPVGKRFMTIEEFESLSRFRETLTMLGIESSALEVGESEYRLSIFDKGQILWRRESNPAIVLSNLEAFLSADAIRTQSDFLDKVLYLDLRTENKVFYKFKE